MIYTTYFAMLKSLPRNIVPISICGKAPDWYTGLQYKKLAPKYDFFMKWKETHDNPQGIRGITPETDPWWGKITCANLANSTTDGEKSMATHEE